jgi:hypothetical protein
VFFHVDYKPNSTESRKVGKDDMSALDKQLELMNIRIKDISREIEHARRQEIAMKEASGKSLCSTAFQDCYAYETASVNVESTAWSTHWFSILSIVILVATSVWQMVYLRTFFASKKLL